MNADPLNVGHSAASFHPLYALMLRLRPRARGELLPNAGQLAHAALLRWLADVDPALATRLHEPNQDRPFTCSSLWFPQQHGVAAAQSDNRRLPVLPEQTYWLRLTLLTDEVFRTLTARFFRPSTLLASGTVGLPALRLGGVQFDVAELIAMAPEAPGAAEPVPQPTAWAGYATYEGLIEGARSRSLATTEGRSIGLEFRSPTAFSDGQLAWGKRMHLFPDADRVFDRLARVWNAWAPAALALDARAVQTYAREWVAVANFDLHTRLLHFDRHAQLGFTGRCVYALMERERQQPAPDATHATGEPIGAGLSGAQALHLLASFAFYAGIGQKTTMGMGQARALPSSPPKAPATRKAEVSGFRSAPVVPYTLSERGLIREVVEQPEGTRP